MVDGKTHVCRFALGGTLDTIVSLQAEIELNFTVDGIVRSVKMGVGRVHEDGNYVLETPPFLWDSAATGVGMYYRFVPVYSSGTPAPVIVLGRPEMRQID